MSDPVKAQKLEMRRILRHELRAMPDAERREASETLCRALLAHPWWGEARTVGLFSPTEIEPDINRLWQKGALQQKTAAYSRVEEGELLFYRVDGLEDLVEEQLLLAGIRKPVTIAVPRERQERRIDPATLDLLLVPGLAFSPDGQRLGKGGGYFDRFLAKSGFTGHSLGLCFSRQLRDVIPTEDHDCTVDQILTEEHGQSA